MQADVAFVTEVGLDVGSGRINSQIALDVGFLDPLNGYTHVRGEQTVGAYPERLELAGAVDLYPIDRADVAVYLEHVTAWRDVLLMGADALALRSRKPGRSHDPRNEQRPGRRRRDEFVLGELRQLIELLANETEDT